MSYQYIPMQRELDAQKLFNEVGADALNKRLDEICDAGQKRLDALPRLTFNSHGECGHNMLNNEEKEERLQILRALQRDPYSTPSAAKERLLERAKNRKLEFEKKKLLKQGKLTNHA